MRFAFRAAVLVAALAVALLGQQPLDNKAVIKLHNAGLTDDTILRMIASEPGHFATGVDDIIAFKRAGISERIIAAVLNKSTSAPAAVPTATPSPAQVPQASPTPAGPHSVTDVFYKKGDGWVAIQAEPVSWKAGGILKSVATVGVKKRDINGTVAGSSSKDKLTLPAEFVMYIPGGVDMREYQLLHLRSHDGAREFRAAIGDDFHISGGRDLVPFDYKAVTRRGFQIDLKDLAPGEYGWVPPDAALNAHDANAPPGKIFTFVVE